MLKQYQIVCALILCVSHVSVYGLRQGANVPQNNVPQNEQEVVQPPVIVLPFRYVQYHQGSTNVTVHFNTGHILNLPNGLTPYQAVQLHGVPNNLNTIVNNNGDRL